MKRPSLIGHVVELLDRIRPLTQPADVVTNEFFRARHYLGAKDRRFIADTLFGILRNYRFVHTLAQEVSGRVRPDATDVPSLLLYAAYALRVQQEPSAAVLSDIEGMVRVFAPKIPAGELVAAIAHALLPPGGDTAQHLALQYSFPDSIVAEWLERFGADETRRLCQSLNAPAPTVIRINSLKTSVEECRRRLQREGIESERTVLSPFGLVLGKRINAQAVRAFQEGLFEMQDEGSQLLSLLLEPREGMIVVDACAGGGGKTLHIAALMGNRGTLYSLDSDPKRLAAIRPRLERAGVMIAELRSSQDEATRRALAGSADAVLVDAPCSGVGRFRRNPDAKLRFTEDMVERMSGLQKGILEESAQLVKPGGRLVYSTCTLLRKENDEIVEWFLSAHHGFHLLPASAILQRQQVPYDFASDFLMLLPHKHATDGFFAAVLQRHA